MLHLQLFGCTAYAKVPKETDSSKINCTSVKYVLIRYYGQDGYKLFDKNTSKVIKSCDVIFEEGTGHQTISEDQNNDEFDIFPIGNTPSIDNAHGCLLHNTNSIAPHNHLTDVSHENIIPSQHDDPPPIPANQIPMPQIV